MTILSVSFFALSMRERESFRSVCADVVDTSCKTEELVRREGG